MTATQGDEQLRVSYGPDSDTMMLALMADPTYVDLLAKNADNFIPGSVHDEIWRAI